MRGAGLLASVRSAGEALLALRCGADLIDAKEPRAGALGALPGDEVSAIVAAVAQRRPVSATIGDLPLRRDRILPALDAMAARGVDFVKIGLFGAVDEAALRAVFADVPALHADCSGAPTVRRIAVLMADQDGDRWPAATLAALGFHGVMLDTADKHCGGLRAVLSPQRLEAFLQGARHCGLLSGLAGSLAEADIAPLLALGPDYLGFRTALCAGRERGGILDGAACVQVRAQFGAQLAALAQAERPSRLMAQSARPA